MNKIKLILLFAAFYVFCLYENLMGITFPVFVAGFLGLYLFFMKKEGRTIKKTSRFYMGAVFLLSVSTFLTDNQWIVGLNLIGICLLIGIVFLHDSYEDRSWSFTKYAVSLLEFCLGTFLSLFSIFKVRSKIKEKMEQEAGEEKENSRTGSILKGLLIAFVLLCVILPLLSSADEVFSNLLGKTLYLVFTKLMLPDQIILMGLMFLWGALFFFGLFYNLHRRNLDPVQKDRRNQEPLTAITFLSVIGVVYLIFCVIQISYLFTGGFRLPTGYSYRSFVREGFFQLLFVCLLNLVLVLICLGCFRENKVLKRLLTFISGCTYIMIISSACRMYIYIKDHQLTQLRIFVLAALLVLAVVLGGVIYSIYRESFPLFRFTTGVVTAVYVILSLSHIDTIIASYNIAHVGLNITYENQYITTLSADAAGVFVDALENGVECTELGEEVLGYYFENVAYFANRGAGIRRFNVSRYLGGKAFERYAELKAE